jgi:hypothetical protein
LLRDQSVTQALQPVEQLTVRAVGSRFHHLLQLSDQGKVFLVEPRWGAEANRSIPMHDRDLQAVHCEQSAIDLLKEPDDLRGSAMLPGESH